MSTAKDATMRRIAIVLSSLPEPVAHKLLATLNFDSQRGVRAALRSLDDVDPLERRRALDGFAKSLRHDRKQSRIENEAAEVVFSRTALRSLDAQQQGYADDPAYRSRSDSRSSDMVHKPAPFAFLMDVDDEMLVSHLSGELPQTLAIILASISPSQAARVLPRLDVTVRIEAMRRMANLGDLPGELVEDIGNQLRKHLPISKVGSGAGRRALDAILAEMQPMPAESHAALGAGVTQGQPAQSIDASRSPASHSPQQASIRIADGTWPSKDEVTTKSFEKVEASSQDAPSKQDSQQRTSSASPLQSTDSIHSYLISLAPVDLRDALARVPIRQGLLVLCGLPNESAEAVLASLPRRQSKQVREQLADLGPLQLREIDEAKEVVATVSWQSQSTSKATTTAPQLSAAA